MLRRHRPLVPASNSNRRRAQELVAHGIAAEKSGSLTEALHCFREATVVDPGFAEAQMNLGIALQTTGELSAAVDCYEHAIELDPESAAAHYNLGLAHLGLKNCSEAETSLRTALRVRSPFPEAWVGLAAALEGMGHDEEALIALEHAVAERADYAGALFNAGLLARKLGRFDAAIAFERRGLEVEPEHYLVHCRLGSTLQSMGRSSEAEASFRLAVALNPDFLEALLNLASVLQAQGHNQESLRFLFDAVERHPDSIEARQALVNSLVDVPLTYASEKIRDILLNLCRDDNVSVRLLSVPLIALLKSTETFRRLQNGARCGEDPLADPDPLARTFFCDPLLIAALPRILILDPTFETVLTYIRRCLLLGSRAGRKGSPVVPLDFMCALAGQCFFSGYAFLACEDELERIATLREDVEAALRESAIDAKSIELPLLVIAMYGYVDSLAGSERLQTGSDWSPGFRSLLEEQVENRRREREIAKRLPALTAIDDHVSQAVRGQYEQHPYPVWAGGVHDLKPESFEELWRRLRPDRPVAVHAAPVPMLVAGCGTGESLLLLAKRYPECAILAVDLSLASLAYAVRMSDRCGVSNISFAQADILELGNLDRRFGIIDCAGVLHHLRDPMEGWRILSGLMEPDGLMRIALYSVKGRREIQPAREFVASLDLPRTPDGIRRCRSAILALPDGHPAKNILACADFFTLNGCRDLLMHVQEHQFTLPGIVECLDQLGLRFLGMQCSAETRRRFTEMFPDNRAAIDLAAWNRFEDAYPATFMSMYSFWCCRKDSRSGAKRCR